ncbi:Crp/Fnr family transcriptional regulator [Glycomyces niveus]|uniref:Crp/Fnr family transcriptional regulator n=1 Tax=Glycomyces niveus TaxID=2820287 RepID=A0ABS3U981_9ACTN|nr:Crp/Fnr family transcriptional regulator [Glycomyces sp. NEAU-S30]MBO3734791.1 Crp/Fnr family transcriptional regulator [Glycomyces sp. NEAU-S30]
MPDDTQASGFLTQEEFDVLAPHCHRVTYPSGSEIVREGDRTDFILYLRSGHIKAVSGDPKSIVYIYAPGKIVGELAPMTGLPRSADLVALHDVEADLVPGAVWLEFLLSHPRANLAMLRHLASRIVSKDQPRTASMTNSERKIAKGLMRLVDAGLGREVEAGLLIKGVTQRDLGSLAGLSRESAAIVLGRWRDAGIVATGRGNLTILDLASVKRLADRGGPPTLDTRETP